MLVRILLDTCTVRNHLHDRFAGGNFTRRAAREPPWNLLNLNLGLIHTVPARCEP